MQNEICWLLITDEWSFLALGCLACQNDKGYLCINYDALLECKVGNWPL